MKKMCLITSVLIALINILIVVFIKNIYVEVVLIFLVTALGIVILYRALLEPISDMKKQLKEVEADNLKLEAMRKEFVANVSHELKTPLTSISGFIETLQDGAAEDPEIRNKFIDIIAIETSRLKRLIEDILVLSEIENREDEKKDKIIIKNSIEGIAMVLEPIAKARNITLITNVENGLYVAGSEDRFKQMLVNLIENAIKYSNDGGRVWINAKMESEHIVISVKDEGIGISKENLERLFERFYRVDKSRSRKVGGTGLGLSIVKHVAALFNAQLKVESELGKGSVFYITFK